jgi:ATP-dependent exoDNAse (exonuclease V) beta subunit
VPGSLNTAQSRRAREAALNFVRKFNPSGYEEADLPASPEKPGGGVEAPRTLRLSRSKTDTPATLYGRWWHELMQRNSWRDPDSWAQTFAQHFPDSPEPSRSTKEWKLWRTCLLNWPDILRDLSEEENFVHSEIPCFWRADERACLEGVIDLAVIDTTNKKFLLFDWKTNRIEPGEIDALRAHYLPQMAAYRTAVARMTGYEGEARIYSTSTGQFIPYNSEELAREWQRLQSLPLPELSKQVDGDEV